LRKEKNMIETRKKKININENASIILNFSVIYYHKLIF